MALYYSGFNGYGHLPGDNSKIMERLIPVPEFNEPLDICCGYDCCIVRQKDTLVLYTGVDGRSHTTELSHVEKPQCFLCTEDSVFVTRDLDIWRSDRDYWSRLEVHVEGGPDERELWSKEENIVKMLHVSPLGAELIALLSNGSVWRISDTGLARVVYRPAVDEAQDIVCGLEHVLILTKNGCLLAFGLGSRGQLGCGDLNSSDAPVQIATFEGLPVRKVAAGGWHSAAVTESGDLYTWGWNTSGELGCPSDDVGVSALPHPLDLDLEVDDVACGTRHTIILAGGDIYSSGWNAYGQLGIATNTDKVGSFTKLDCTVDSSSRMQLKCGPWSTVLLTHNLSS